MSGKRVFLSYTRGDIVNFAVLMILAFAIVPYTIQTDYWYSSILIPWLCLALAALGQQFVMGYAGQLALGAAGFMAAGAFACYNIELRLPWMPFPISLILSGLIASAFGVLFGLPSLRVRGIYLMVATLASQFFIIWMIDKFGWFKNYDTSGIITAQDIVIFGQTFTSPMAMYLVVAVVVTVLTILAVNLTRGSVGRNWMAVRDMDIAAESMGISLLRTKLQAFALSAFYCGVAGALFAFTYLKSLEPAAFDIKLSFQILFMVILGGLGTVKGAFIGAAFILLFPVVLNNVGNAWFHGMIDATIMSATEQVVFGALIILFLIYEPLGMAKLWGNMKERLLGERRVSSASPAAKPNVG